MNYVKIKRKKKPGNTGDEANSTDTQVTKRQVTVRNNLAR